MIFGFFLRVAGISEDWTWSFLVSFSSFSEETNPRLKRLVGHKWRKKILKGLPKWMRCEHWWRIERAEYYPAGVCDFAKVGYLHNRCALLEAFFPVPFASSTSAPFLEEAIELHWKLATDTREDGGRSAVVAVQCVVWNIPSSVSEGLGIRVIFDIIVFCSDYFARERLIVAKYLQNSMGKWAPLSTLYHPIQHTAQ